MARTVLGNITRIQRCFTLYRKRKLKGLDLLPSMYSIINYVSWNPGCMQEELGQELCLDKTTVTHHLAKLEEKGYVERKIASEDARKRRVYLTEKSGQILPAMHETYEEFLEGLMDGLTEEESENAKRLLDHVYDNAIHMVDETKK